MIRDVNSNLSAVQHLINCLSSGGKIKPKKEAKEQPIATQPSADEVETSDDESDYVPAPDSPATEKSAPSIVNVPSAPVAVLAPFVPAPVVPAPVVSAPAPCLLPAGGSTPPS
jgi:hypothetical protein